MLSAQLIRPPLPMRDAGLAHTEACRERLLSQPAVKTAALEGVAECLADRRIALVGP